MSDESFPRSDIALQQAVHGARLAHVGDDFFDGSFLCAGEVEGEAFVKGFQQGGFFSEDAAMVGEVAGALPDDVELEGEKALQGEAAAGGFAGFGGGGKMGFEEVGGAVVRGYGKREGEGVVFGMADAIRRHVVDDLAQAALVEAGDVLVDWDDAVEVDRFLAIVGNDLDLRVVDDEASALLLHFSISDHLLPGGDDLGHERHVEPAAGDFPGAEYPAGAIHDDGLVETGFSEALGARVDDAAVEADGFSGG